jgi:hypothetical protein
MRRPRRLGFLIVVCAVAACASPNPKLYTIAPVQGPVHSGTPKVIVVHQVGTAHYLERDQIVRSSENYRLEVMSNDWWGEPLSAMLGRVLVQELNQRLPRSTVYLSGGAISATPDATVELELQRLDMNAAGELVLLAQAAVTLNGRAKTPTRSFRLLVPPPQPGIAGQVAATSTALGQVADGIASMLAGAR